MKNPAHSELFFNQNGRIGVLTRPENCVDVERAKQLNGLQRPPNTAYDTILTTGALMALFRLAQTTGGRMSREDLTGSPARPKCSAEDMRELQRRCWVKDRGVLRVEITDEGNAFVRELVEFARAKGVAS